MALSFVHLFSAPRIQAAYPTYPPLASSYHKARSVGLSVQDIWRAEGRPLLITNSPPAHRPSHPRFPPNSSLYSGLLLDLYPLSSCALYDLRTPCAPIACSSPSVVPYIRPLFSSKAGGPSMERKRRLKNHETRMAGQVAVWVLSYVSFRFVSFRFVSSFGPYHVRYAVGVYPALHPCHAARVPLALDRGFAAAHACPSPRPSPLDVGRMRLLTICCSRNPIWSGRMQC
jgi:hypothetical protein